ncbi:hypothetical protein ACLOJK_034728 [Asimina triloba]
MGFPAKPPSANRSRPSRRPHTDPSIQLRISFVFFNRQQWWTTSCSSSVADNTSSQRLPSSIQADAVQHQWPGSMQSDPGQQLRPNSDGLKPISPSTRRPPAANRPPISSVHESSPSVDDRAPARLQSSPLMSSEQHRSAPSSSSIFPMGRPRATV